MKTKSVVVSYEIDPIRMYQGIALKNIRERLNRDLERPGQLESGFDCDHSLLDTEWMELVQEWRWLACYVVAGNSEGHYIHIDLMRSRGEKGKTEAMSVFTAKTFGGFPLAHEMANAACYLLTGGDGELHGW